MEYNTREKIKRQIELQQTEEDLRKLLNQIAALEIQSRQYHQEFNRAEMNLRDVEARIKNAKSAEFELNQKIITAKKALLDSIAGR